MVLELRPSHNPNKTFGFVGVVISLKDLYFPVGQHDDVTDAFCHGMKSFTTERDFKTPNLEVIPGHLQSEYEARQQELFEEWKWEHDTRIGEDF